MNQGFDSFGWWNSLRHSGLLLDRKRLAELYPAASPTIPFEIVDGLRRTLELGHSQTKDSSLELIDFVLSVVCGFREGWKKGPQVDASWTRRDREGNALRPDRLWTDSHGCTLPVFIDKESKTLGLGKGRRVVSKVLGWMRSGPEKLAVLTNGRQWRLLHAGLDYEAWCESDSDLWFEDGASSVQLHAIVSLLDPRVWTSFKPNGKPLLLQAIEDSRKGQADLSASLGERVRLAVEKLIDAHQTAIDKHGIDIPPAELYRGAVRVVMRLVVVLFAEARGLLPVDNAVYHASYGLRGLQDDLRKIARAQKLSSSQSAWPRLLALFRLVHDGSAHPDLLVPGYGGELFQPGLLESTDGLRRAIWIFENACFKDDSHGVPDKVMSSILEHLTRTIERIRSGLGTINVPVPVDFSDLSSEYIGILYEGLLDYELKLVPEGDAVIILPIGNRPALPLSRLEAMTDAQLAELLAKFAKDSKVKASDAEEEEQEEPEEEEEVADAENEDESIDDPSHEEEVIISNSDVYGLGERVTNFLRRMVEQGKLVAKPRGTMTPEKEAAYRSDIEKKAIIFARDVHFPGKRYLVRWGGTRKGSGAFYTRPGLSGPLIHRTLAPLAYVAPLNADGTENRDAMLSEWTPSKPEEILALKVCDIACGSGTFPVGALRFLTQALYDSVHFHERITLTSDHRTAVSFFGQSDTGESIADEYLPCLPDDETYEARLRGRLKRHVAERCIYGVDFDPLAVELCRLSIWVETLDQDLPFTFLNHKIKCGNSLVGCWYDRYEHYPPMAFAREAGDKNHSTSINFPVGLETAKIERFLKGNVIPDLTDTIQGQGQLFAAVSRELPSELHHKIRDKLDSLHALPIHATEKRANLYRDLLTDADFNNLRDSFDLWCSLWFWPVDQIDAAPLPSSFRLNTEDVKAIVRQCSNENRFFHWELEFPDVFNGPRGGFDAIIGNPPWDIAKPNSKEFFSNLDPLFRIYGKQDALEAQRDIFRGAKADERRWLDYNAAFKSFGNWMRFAGSPFGDRRSGAAQGGSRDLSFGRGNDGLHDVWASSRALVNSFAASDPKHPFLYQGGGDVNLYKCFLEQVHALLRTEGRFGQVVPSGIHTDKGTQTLRVLMRDKCSWEWCFTFENRRKLFPIHRSYKFDVLVSQKSSITVSIRCASMRHELSDWAVGNAETISAPYRREEILNYSPLNDSLMEVRGKGDIAWLNKAYDAANCLLDSQDGFAWAPSYAREFDLTNDSRFFPNRARWETEGYKPDCYGRWIKGEWSSDGLGPDAITDLYGLSQITPKRVASAETRIKVSVPGSGRKVERAVVHPAVAVPLYQGVMLWQFDFRYRSDAAGRGRANWQESAVDASFPIGYFLIPLNFLPRGTLPRIGFRDIGANTNRRTLVPALLPPFPNGNKVPILSPKNGSQLAFLACLGSFVADAALRLKISQATINWFYVQELPLPPSNAPHWTDAFDRFVLGLCGRSPWFVNEWLKAVPVELRSKHTWHAWWVKSVAENQRRRAVIDAVVAHAYGLSVEDLRWLLKDCSHPTDFYRNRESRRQLDPKGFWRVDEDMPAPIRHTTLCLQAFIDLTDRISNGESIAEAVNAMTGLEPNQGWHLPNHAQEIFTAEGFNAEIEYIKQTPAESWLEVERHRKQLFETPLWNGALSENAIGEIQPETFQ
ncbi:hypothetical protein MCEMIEM12_00294 [Burkholderiaceae bacterium]